VTNMHGNPYRAMRDREPFLGDHCCNSG
jgi:hypothetical protein